MKILQSIEKALAKRKEKTGNDVIATLRQDVVRRAIERGEFENIKCAYHYTDDYAWDNANDFGKNNSVSKESMLHQYNVLTPSCWVSPKLFEINGKQCYEISISFHSNLAYDMYVPVAEKNSDEPEKFKVLVTENEERDGVEIKFAGKPSEETRNILKKNKFRWHGKEKKWYAKRNEQTLETARKIQGLYADAV